MGRPKRDWILILDFGSQYNQLIARRVRESQVYCELHPYNISLNKIRRWKPRGIILSGGPASVYEPDAPLPDAGIYELGIPILGICYGQQVMAHQLGGKVKGSSKREYGHARLSVDEPVALFEGFDGSADVWMSHGDAITELPPGFKRVAYTANAPYAAIATAGFAAGSIQTAKPNASEPRLAGIQFHPEVVHTPRGAEMLSNFVHKVCGCGRDWTMQNFLARQTEAIRKTVGPSGRVLCAVSGGVDSTVGAMLLHHAIGERAVPVFVNNGLLRAGEADEVQARFAEILRVPLVYVDATDRFLSALSGVKSPERKRKIIGRVFCEVFRDEAARLSEHGKIDWLMQGTIYPDVIESRSVKGPSATIKSHHNVGGMLKQTLNLKLIEPFRELFKDEIRALGHELGIDAALVGRHPFPGPGLAVRLIGACTRKDLEILRRADAIVIEEIRKAGLYDRIGQAFAVLLPVKSVGVMGDSRSYERVCAVRAVETVDFMTADWFDMPRPVLRAISNRIINEVREINRVVYDISSKPPSTIEWE
ncbi:glutamine-hydrolyzing GMP synthase [bacterium]|nr:glutamine-hydrolyzing GMP synthase [bacterium]